MDVGLMGPHWRYYPWGKTPALRRLPDPGETDLTRAGGGPPPYPAGKNPVKGVPLKKG